MFSIFQTASIETVLELSTYAGNNSGFKIGKSNIQTVLRAPSQIPVPFLTLCILLRLAPYRPVRAYDNLQIILAEITYSRPGSGTYISVPEVLFA